MSVLEVTARRSAKRTYLAADARAEQILDCALAVFSERGYHRASIADVCARAKIGRATLYQYFDDKRDVLAALANRIAERVTNHVAARSKLRIPPGIVLTTEQAARFVEGRLADVLRIVFEDAATARLVLRSGRGADDLVDEILSKVDATVLAVMEEDLRTSIAAGLVRPVDARFVALYFLGGLEKTVLAELEAGRPVDVVALAHEATLLQLIGIFQPQAGAVR